MNRPLESFRELSSQSLKLGIYSRILLTHYQSGHRSSRGVATVQKCGRRNNLFGGVIHIDPFELDNYVANINLGDYKISTYLVSPQATVNTRPMKTNPLLIQKYGFSPILFNFDL